MIFQFGSKTKMFGDLLRRNKPYAQAILEGGENNKGLYGKVQFYPVYDGTLVAAEIFGLPKEGGKCPGRFFGFHIHEGKSCFGTKDNPFSASGPHYNPGDCPHPFHAGDLPPLISDSGYAWLSFYTKRFQVEEIVGHTVIIHSKPDDFKTQPSGDSGEKIACGIIKKM